MGNNVERRKRAKPTSRAKVKPESTSPRSPVAKFQDLEDTAVCKNCQEEERSYRRTFSEQAWTVLLLWKEISPEAVEQPICDSCYDELREILIDRRDEIELAMSEETEVAKIRAIIAEKAS